MYTKCSDLAVNRDKALPTKIPQPEPDPCTGVNDYYPVCFFPHVIHSVHVHCALPVSGFQVVVLSLLQAPLCLQLLQSQQWHSDTCAFPLLSRLHCDLRNAC